MTSPVLSTAPGLRVGRFEAYALEIGDFKLDGGAMNGSIPRVLWERQSPPDEANRIAMRCAPLLLASDDAKVLIDAGIGERWSPKFRAIYAIREGQPTVVDALARVGVAPDQITHVILTHLHFDHVGGATRVDGDRVVPTFPRARHIVQRRQWEHAMAPHETDVASYRADDFIPLADAGLVDRIDGEAEVLPGISVRVFEGHTKAMQCPLVDDERPLFFCADLIPLASHLRLPYIMGYDLCSETTLAEKKRVLAEAVAGRWRLFFEHDPDTRCATVREGERYPELGETVPIPRVA